MTQGYTKGEWEAEARIGYWIITTKTNHIGEISRRHNAHRICACVNACQGLNPKAIPEVIEKLEQIATLLVNPLTTRQEKSQRLRLIRANNEAWQLTLEALAEIREEV